MANENDVVKEVLNRVKDTPRIYKVHVLLEKFKALRTNPGDGSFTSIEDKLLYTALDYLQAEVEDLVSCSHNHGDTYNGPK